MVLTQPSKPKDGSEMLLEFPYHYGSHATIQGLEGRRTSSQFPYHYGSHATRMSKDGLSLQDAMFPYHYGSHATHRESSLGCKPIPSFHTTMVLTQQYNGYRTRSACKVSIPLWFSRNKGKVNPPCNRQPVSIPLWFSRNISVAEFGRKYK